MLNPRRAKEFVVPSTLTRCITRAALFFKNVPGTFFNATHQVKAIAIGVSEANPLGELTECSTSVHLHVSCTEKPQISNKELFPNTHFILGLYV